MSKYIRYILFCTLCLLSGALLGGAPGDDDITQKAFRLLKETIEQNRLNDLEGYSYRNEYVVEVNLDPNWVEERGASTKVLSSKYESISTRLKSFNSTRNDKLRAYVIVVNDWELRLKQHVNIDLLPSRVELDAISKQAETDQAEEKKRIENELNGVPSGVSQQLKKHGYTDIAVCFGANVKFYTVDNGGAPNSQVYKYTTVFLSGQKLLANKDAIRAKIKRAGTSLESDIELMTFSLTDGIKEVIDQQKPLSLAYKVSNTTVNDWYITVGEKNTTPFSTATTDQQVYDYTGVFASKKNDIVNLLPDPTAKVIITDNLTADETIDNIKSLVAKPLPVNVFWFHLDRKGELHTQLYLAESVKQRLAKEPGNVAGDLDAYIGKLYKEAGPKIKSAADLVDFLNIEAHVFRALNYVLANAEIPSSWWNASDPDYLLGIWGRYISPQTGLTFAYICGVWNGVVSNLSLVSTLLSLKSELQGVFFKILVDDDYRNELFSDIQFYASNIGILMELGYEMVKAEISKKVQEEWNKLKNGDATSVAYVGGLATVEVLVAIYTAGIAEAVKAELMAIKFIRVPVEFILKIGKFMLRPVAYIIKAGGKIVWDGIKWVLKQGEEVIASIAADGKLIIYKLLSTAEKIVDEIPILQMEVVFNKDGTAGIKYSFAKTETGWGFKRRSEFLDALSKSLANYPALRDKILLLSKDLQEKFINDFLENSDEVLLKELDNAPRLVDAWKMSVDAGFQNSWRTDVDFLKSLRNVWEYTFVNGNEAVIPNVVLTPTVLTKIDATALAQMRSAFNSTAKPNFLRTLASNPRISKMLKKAGFSDSEIPALIQRLSAGQGIPGYQVHHKVPLDFGGTNDFQNLVLIKQDPYHSAITSFQNSKISLSPGQTLSTSFPKIEGSFYSPPYIE